jgi:hypothetical protein
MCFLVFLIFPCLSRHDGLWAQSIRKASLRREEVEHFNNIEHDVNRQKLWKPLEWKSMPNSTAPFFDLPDATFNFRHMLIAAGYVKHGTTGHRIEQRFEGCKFPVRVDHFDMETTVKVNLLDVVDCFKNWGTVLSVGWLR